MATKYRVIARPFCRSEGVEYFLDETFAQTFGLKRKIEVGEIGTLLPDDPGDGDLALEFADGNGEAISPECLELIEEASE